MIKKDIPNNRLCLPRVCLLSTRYIYREDEAQSTLPKTQKRIVGKPTTDIKEKPLPPDIKHRPSDLQKLYRRLRSRQEWIDDRIVVDIVFEVFGTPTFSLTISYDEIRLLLNRGCLDHTIIIWFQLQRNA